MATRLVVWTNSFQTLDEAIDIAYDRVDLGGILDGSIAYPVIESALIQAYHAINRFTFYDYDFRETKSEPFSISELTSDERDLLTTDFMYVLRLAQTAEADSLLGGESNSVSGIIEEKRRAGIREETVGESSVKFNLTSDTRSIVRKRTLEILSPYIYSAVRIGRA